MALIRCEHGAYAGEWCGRCDDIVQRHHDGVADFARHLAEAKVWMLDIHPGIDAADLATWSSGSVVRFIRCWYVGGWDGFVADGMAHQGGES